jgi:hypothetical protein
MHAAALDSVRDGGGFFGRGVRPPRASMSMASMTEDVMHDVGRHWRPS